ncbi:hypothetical protein MVI01_09600 [Myxococcus virescens]|nr:hypothetical protein MVI01_09600 [Myxococcus virescens]
MFTPLKNEAIRCYRLLNEISLSFGLIEGETLETRLRYLDELLSDPNRGPLGSEPSDTRDTEELGRAFERGDPTKSNEAHPDIVAAGGSPPPDWLQLIPSGTIGHLSRWEFIKGDPDPHPSVPHGHDQGRTFPKLDPYLGWIHVSTTKRGGRLSKNDTRALWNDERFRDFASAALVHFIQENPGYVWRVERPLRLPRRR